MKKFKKLIPALCMLLVSAVMLGTTTFAWFSMNDKVTATGMQIEAKTNDTYLLISKDNQTAETIQNEKSITANFGMGETKLYPAAPCMNTTEEGYLTTTGKKVGEEAITTAGVKITNKATAEAVTNWYTAQAAAASASGIKEETVRQLTSFTDYVENKTLYLTVAKGVNAANKLTVTPTFTAKNAKTITGIKILVVVTYEDNATVVTTLTSTSTKTNLYTADTNKITDSKVATVSLFLYYDGNDSSVYTNNVANLDGATISLAFEVSTVAA